MSSTPQSLISTRNPYEQTQLARYGVLRPELLSNPDCPVEYITGKCEFAGLVLNVTPATLIPRLETEELLEQILAAQAELLAGTATQEINILDMGTGSGAIGLGLAKMFLERYPQHQLNLTLSEVSAHALAVARQNQQLLGEEARLKVKLIEADIWRIIDTDTGLAFDKYDLIIANLPYIPSQRIDYLPPSVKDFEPHLALDGGPEGLSLIERLLSEATDYLRPTGQIWLEVDHTHDQSWFQKNFPQFAAQQFSDSFGQQRFLQLSLKASRV